MANLNFTYEDVAGMIDHSLLNPTLPVAELDLGIQLAIRYDVASVCIMPFYLKRCAELLRGAGVAPSTTIGFPHGGHTTATKLAEAQQALADGCQELDMVVNISQVLSGDWDYVRDDIADCRRGTRFRREGQSYLRKLLSESRAEDPAVRDLRRIGADWVKTSTGYGTGGATMEDLALMRRHSPDYVQVKAAGGVRDLDALLEVRALGVTRVGATRTASMLDECRRRLEMPAVAS